MAADYKEVKGKVGFFGLVWRVLFWGWQLLMIVWFLTYTVDVAPLVEGAQSDAARAGASIGIAFSWGLILFFWVGGTVILGLFVLMTRRTRMLVPVDKED